MHTGKSSPNRAKQYLKKFMPKAESPFDTGLQPAQPTRTYGMGVGMTEERNIRIRAKGNTQHSSSAKASRKPLRKKMK